MSIADELQVLVIGQTPPPHNGMSSATAPLLEVEGVQVSLLDVADARPLKSSGQWTITNALDAFGVALRLVKRQPWRFDLAHVPIAQNTPGVLRDALILVILRASRVPYVIHLHGGYFDQWYRCTSVFMRWIARLTIGHAARGLVLSGVLVDCLECVLPVSRITICENGTTPPTQTPARGSTDEPGLTVLHIGALTPEKGTLELIEAATSLEHIRLVLAGEAWPEVELAACHSRIALTGPVSGSAKAALFSQADVMCLPTRYPFEGQPIALLEAMSVGIPIVATRRAAIEETVGDAGIYVPEGDRQALADALATLRDDHTLRAQLGARGRARYEERYTADAYRARVVAVWRDVAARERGKA